MKFGVLFLTIIVLAAYPAFAGTKTCSNSDGSIRVSVTYSDGANTLVSDANIIVKGKELPYSGTSLDFGRILYKTWDVTTSLSDNDPSQGSQRMLIYVTHLRVSGPQNGPELGNVKADDDVICTELQFISGNSH